MKKILACILSVSVLLCMSSFGAFAQEFTDMPDNWATAALERAVSDGLINGYDGRIMPDDNLTRAQMAAIFVRAFSVTEREDLSRFEDMDESAWYYKDMEKAVKAGWFKGDGNRLNPDAPITREEAFTVIARAFSLPLGTADALVAYSDSANVSDWAVPYVAAMLNRGLVAGSNGMLNPKSNISRAEFAVVMDRAVAAYVYEEGVLTFDLNGHKGAVIIKSGNITLKDMTIHGDLIYSGTIDASSITLQNVNVEGRVINNSSYTTDKENNKPGGIGTGTNTGTNTGTSTGTNTGTSTGTNTGTSTGNGNDDDYVAPDLNNPTITPDDSGDVEDPADPADPTDPEDPTDPTDPEGPTEPEDPTDPEDPTEPEDPTDPEDPTEPEDPTDYEDPEGGPFVDDYEEPKDPFVSIGGEEIEDGGEASDEDER